MPWSDRIARQFKLRDLHIFVGRGAIRQHGKSRRAACDVQPVVPKAVSDMEHALGVRLLDQR